MSRNTAMVGGLRVGLLGIASMVLMSCAPSAATPTAAPASKAAPAAPAASPGAAPAASPAAKAGPAVEIRIGTGVAAEEQLWLMAAMPEITPNQGKAYNLTVTTYRAASERLNAYEAGQLEGASVVTQSLLFAAENGLPMKVVASIAREKADPNYFNTGFLALSDGDIKSAKDLVGKTIGCVDFKHACDLYVMEAMSKAGVDPKSAKFTIIPFPAMGESLRTKKIDLAYVAQPFYDQEMAKGGLTEVFNTKNGPGITIDNELLTLFFRPEFVTANNAAVKAFLSDFVAATKYYAENTKQARQALIDKKFVASPPEIYLTQKDYYREPSGKVSVEGFELIQDLHVKYGWQTKKVNIKDLVDTSLLPN